MPAYFDTGFSVRQPMWHGEGIVLDAYPEDWDDARMKAGLMWEPEAVPGYQFVQWTQASEFGTWLAQFGATEDARREAGVLVLPDVGIVRPLPDHKLIIRDDNRDVLAPVGAGFELISHGQMGEIIESFLGEGAKFETAGSCRNGAQVWALAYLDEPYTVAGDNTETYPFLALLNAHDGSGACKLVRTQVRVVCWNTYRAAEMEGERTGMQYTFRHTANVHERIEEAKHALSGLRDAAKEWDAMATELFGMKVDSKAFEMFVSEFIPEPPADIVSPRVRNNIEAARRQFRSMYLDGITNEAHRGTALGVVDCAVEYLDHVRGYRNHDTYLGRTLLRPEPLKAKAVRLVREVCNA